MAVAVAVVVAVVVAFAVVVAVDDEVSLKARVSSRFALTRRILLMVAVDAAATAVDVDRVGADCGVDKNRDDGSEVGVDTDDNEFGVDRLLTDSLDSISMLYQTSNLNEQ